MPPAWFGQEFSVPHLADRSFICILGDSKERYQFTWLSGHSSLHPIPLRPAKDIVEQLLPSGVVDRQGVPLTSAAEDLDEGVEGGEEEDTRLARAFLMGTSRVAFWGGQTLLHSKCFVHQKRFPESLRPQKL